MSGSGGQTLTFPYTSFGVNYVKPLVQGNFVFYQNTYGIPALNLTDGTIRTIVMNPNVARAVYFAGGASSPVFVVGTSGFSGLRSYTIASNPTIVTSYIMNSNCTDPSAAQVYVSGSVVLTVMPNAIMCKNDLTSGADLGIFNLTTLVPDCSVVKDVKFDSQAIMRCVPRVPCACR